MEKKWMIVVFLAMSFMLIEPGGSPIPSKKQRAALAPSSPNGNQNKRTLNQQCSLEAEEQLEAWNKMTPEQKAAFARVSFTYGDTHYLKLRREKNGAVGNSTFHDSFFGLDESSELRGS